MVQCEASEYKTSNEEKATYVAVVPGTVGAHSSSSATTDWSAKSSSSRCPSSSVSLSRTLPVLRARETHACQFGSVHAKREGKGRTTAQTPLCRARSRYLGPHCTKT